MWKIARKRRRFNLIDIIIIIVTVIIICASTVPKLSGMVDNSKSVRARTQIENIGLAVLRLYANTGQFPGSGEKLPNRNLYTLVSGNAKNPVPLPGYGTKDHNPVAFVADRADFDYLDNHLVLNQLKSKTGNAYPLTGEKYWNGPYLPSMGADPWGRAYMVSFVPAYEGLVFCYVLSAGPDGIIQTALDNNAPSPINSAPGIDDIALILPLHQSPVTVAAF